MSTLGPAIGQQWWEIFHLDRSFYLVCSEVLSLSLYISVERERERERELIAYECTSHPSSIKAMKKYIMLIFEIIIRMVAYYWEHAIQIPSKQLYLLYVHS
jgi:hypothetical protein